MHNEIYIKVFPQCVSLGKLNFCIQGNDRERERDRKLIALFDIEYVKILQRFIYHNLMRAPSRIFPSLGNLKTLNIERKSQNFPG
jgi:hypothetical protein